MTALYFQLMQHQPEVLLSARFSHTGKPRSLGSVGFGTEWYLRAPFYFCAGKRSGILLERHHRGAIILRSIEPRPSTCIIIRENG